MDLAKFVKDFSCKYSTELFSTAAAVGVVGTAFLASKATLKVNEMIEADREVGVEYDKKGLFLLAWKEYIPALTTGVVTIGCILAAHRIGSRRAAVLAAAYSVSDRAFTEYKEKVRTKFGENKERSVRDDIAQDKVTAKSAPESIVITDGTDVLCMEAYTGRYFKCDMETLKKAQNDLNFQIISDDYASLSDFYSIIGLPNTKNSDDIGWNTNRKLELVFTTALTNDGKPCIVFDYFDQPSPAYYRVYN